MTISRHAALLIGVTLTPAAERDAVALGLVEDFAGNPILGEPGVFWAVGTTALIVAAALALRRAGAPLAPQLLLGGAALIGAHAPPPRPDRTALLRRGRLDGAPGTTHLGHGPRTAGRPSRRVGSLKPQDDVPAAVSAAE